MSNTATEEREGLEQLRKQFEIVKNECMTFSDLVWSVLQGDKEFDEDAQSIADETLGFILRTEARIKWRLDGELTEFALANSSKEAEGLALPMLVGFSPIA